MPKDSRSNVTRRSGFYQRAGVGSWHLDLLVIPPDTPAYDADGALALVVQGHTIRALHAILTSVSQQTGSIRCASQC